MRVRIVCDGGPSEYADRIWDEVEADDAGYVLLPPAGETGPDAWYHVDPDAAPVATQPGQARPARYVADYLPS